MTGGAGAQPVLETARLRLRIVHERDAATAVRLLTPAVCRWLASWPSPLEEGAAAARLRQMREAAREGSMLPFAIEPREGGELIGLVMIARTRGDARRGGLGYWLGEPYHHRGYMAEAAAAAVTDAFRRLNLNAIEAGAQPDNAASLAIMRRLGMRPIGERMVWAEARGREEVCAYFEITRAEHEARRAGRTSQGA
jgi:[ribosomal protein S5]-alanine N-acetyltransferase